MSRRNSTAPLSAGAVPPEETYAKLSVSAVRRIYALALPYRVLLLLAGVLTLFSTGISLSLPVVARSALDRTLHSHRVADLDLLALTLVGMVILGSALGYAQYLLVAYAGNRVVMELRRSLFAHLLRLPVPFFDTSRSGDLASHLSNDVSLLQTTLTDDLVRLGGNVVTLLGGIGLALYLDARLTLVVVTLLLAVTSLFVIFGKRLRQLTRLSLDALSDTMGSMTESLGSIRLVKAFARERFEENRAGGKLQNVLRLSMKSSAMEGAFGTVAFAGFLLVLLGVVWYGGRAVLGGTLTAGSLLAFLMTITIISGPMGSLATQFARLQRAIGASERLFGILDTPVEPPDTSGAKPFPDGAGRIEFNQIRFGYNAEVTVLNDLTLSVPAGKVTALVGASGEGKTTLTLLLYRFYETQGGAISIDGVPITELQREALRENIGLVPQEPILFNGTLRENLLYGKLDATSEELERAAKAANVEEFALKLPDGYETRIGERGITLSGGQRQRVAIARAILKDPRILALDEATSALDTQSEALVQEALERLMRGRTTLVIAHRLSTIIHADQIAVIEGGRIVETGRHETLIGAGGRYAELHRAGGVRTLDAEAVPLSASAG